MSERAPWVCLMYHDVAADRTVVTGGPAYFSVSAAVFDRQLDQLQEMGRPGRSIAGVLDGKGEPSTAISFDDGDLGQATRAFPALAKRGMSATFFVTTGWIGTPRYASWDQLREMHAAGMRIESHTHTHPFLSELSRDALIDELRRSKAMIEDHLGHRVTMLALPGGDAPRRSLRSLFAAEGYDVVATSRWGLNDGASSGGLRLIRRCTVRGESTAAEFGAVVRGDPWVARKRQTREAVLHFVRSSLGPTRYSRIRRRVLDVVGRRSESSK